MKSDLLLVSHFMYIRRRWEKKKRNEPRRQKLAKFIAVGQACVVVGWPVPGLKEVTTDCSGFSADGTLIYVHMVSSHGEIDCDCRGLVL